MKFGNRMLSVMLAAALLLGLLAGCGGDNGDGSASDATSIEVLTGLKPEEVLFTVDGVDVTAGDYCYWLAYSIENASYYFYGGGDIVWTDEQDGVPMDEFVKNDAQEVATVFALVEKKAADYNVTLSEDDQAQLKQIMADYVTAMGENAWSEALEAGTVSEDMSDEDRAAWIEENGAQALADRCYQLGTTVDGLEKLERITLLFNNLQAALTAEGGPIVVTDEAVAAYLEEQDMYRAKHILISNKDADGNLLEGDALAQARQRAEDILAQLSQSEDPLALFDQLMNEYSEDPGLAYYPDGYFFEGSTMVEEFTNAVKGLKENEISGIVESDHGYHIILRMPSVDDDARSAYAEDAFQALLDQWLAEATVEERDAFVNLDVQSFSANLSALNGEESAS